MLYLWVFSRQDYTLVGKASSVAHQKHILWRMGGAPQNSRHKNKDSVAHLPMRHRKSYFCGAPGGGAPQKQKVLFLWRTTAGAPQNFF
jgi:hypothetical protein